MNVIVSSADWALTDSMSGINIMIYDLYILMTVYQLLPLYVWCILCMLWASINTNGNIYV